MPILSSLAQEISSFSDKYLKSKDLRGTEDAVGKDKTA